MRHVFDDLGLPPLRVEVRQPQRARRVAPRSGSASSGRAGSATPLVYKGRNRDTDWFSITDGEWPRVRAALDAWLDDDNFDDMGRQRTRLAARAPRPDQQEA